MAGISGRRGHLVPPYERRNIKKYYAIKKGVKYRNIQEEHD